MANRPYRRNKHKDKEGVAPAENTPHAKPHGMKDYAWILFLVVCALLFTANKAPSSEEAQVQSKEGSSTATTTAITTTTTPPTTALRASVGEAERSRLTNPPPELGEPTSNRKIMLVHLGHAGGLIMWANINQPVYKPEQKLASQTTHHLHMWDTFPDQVRTATSLLFTVHNPVERVIANYRHAHPRNCRKDIDNLRPSYGCWLLQENRLQGGFGFVLFVKCFPDPGIEDFAQALLPPFHPNTHFTNSNYDANQITLCRKAARAAASASASPEGHTSTEGILPHNEYNYQYWAHHTYLKFPEPPKEIFVLRKDWELNDMIALDQNILHGSGEFPRLTPTMGLLPDENQFFPSPVSEEAYHKLCCVLENEIRVYLEIVYKALNLADPDKQAAELEMRQKCGLGVSGAWDTWRRNCQQKSEQPLDLPAQ